MSKYHSNDNCSSSSSSVNNVLFRSIKNIMILIPYYLSLYWLKRFDVFSMCPYLEHNIEAVYTKRAFDLRLQPKKKNKSTSVI